MGGGELLDGRRGAENEPCLVFSHHVVNGELVGDCEVGISR